MAKKQEGRIAIPRLVHLHPSVRCAALARLSRVDDLPLACSTGHEHEEKSVHGRAASVGRLLAEAKDYSQVKCNVNGYFVAATVMLLPFCGESVTR